MSGTPFNASRPAIAPELVALSRGVASEFFLLGEPDGGRDELRQVALIGVWQAIRDHRPERGPLYPFVRLVVERRLRDRLKEANRQKRIGDRDALRSVLSDGVPVSAAETVEDPRGDVHETVAARIELARIRALLPELSPLERRSILGLAAGLSYEEIGPHKAVDNAIQRARRKLAA